ncbi:MAG: 2-phospho-L-lactate guanylyltransferase [Nitrososphaerales archaeon]|nr:2-phospho-L-lactate guanylyltransferase [Nitrososphaerales archaeon]
MEVTAIIPVKSLINAKRRLSSILNFEERCELTLCMLNDVLKAIKDSNSIKRVIVVSPDQRVLNFSMKFGVSILKEEQDEGVNAAVNKAVQLCLKDGIDSIIIFPSDIPLLSPIDIDNIVKMADGPRVMVITPALRLNGTNALFLNPPDLIRTFYDEDSFHNHLRLSLSIGAKTKIYLSKRVMLDIDSLEDISIYLSNPSKTATYSFLKKVKERILKIRALT